MSHNFAGGSLDYVALLYLSFGHCISFSSDIPCALRMHINITLNIGLLLDSVGTPAVLFVFFYKPVSPRIDNYVALCVSEYLAVYLQSVYFFQLKCNFVCHAQPCL